MFTRTKRVHASVVRFRRTDLVRFKRFTPVLSRTRRIEVGVGYYVPTEKKALEASQWSNSVVAQYFRKVSNVKCYLNTLEDFKGEANKAIAKIFTRYAITKSEQEFEKIYKTAIVNSSKDHMRKLFRKKRWGQEGSFNDNFVNPSANKSENEERNFEDVESETVNNNATQAVDQDTQSLLNVFQDQISPESFQILKALLEEDIKVCSKSRKISRRFGVPSSFVSAAMFCGFSEKISELYTELKEVACTLVQQGYIDIDATKVMSLR